MKKDIFLILVLSIFGTKSLAYDISVKNADSITIYYSYINNGKELEVSQGSYSGFVNIPDSVMYMDQTCSVTSIGKFAFRDCSFLTSVAIPNSVNRIGYGAFYGCSGLTSVTIPDNVKSIGDVAFYNCSGLTSVSIPNSVTNIGMYVFWHCIGLTSVTIPNSVTSIGESTYAGCSGLTSIQVESGNAYYDSRDNCNAIIETSSNTLIAGCSRTIIPNSVTSIKKYAFYGSIGLTNLAIPNSVTSIGDLAFGGCIGLPSVVIPNSVTNIAPGAFRNCSSLTSITIPNSVESIGYDTFAGCSGLTSIQVERGNTYYDSRDNCNAIIETSSNTLIVGCSNTTIPNSVTGIGDYAFYGRGGLTTITIPNSVKRIGIHAFSDCIGLTSVTIPNSVTSIENCAFDGCSSLTSVTIGNGVTSISPYAFSGCNLTEVISKIKNPFNIRTNTFSDSTFYNATLFVPVGTIGKYKATEGWKGFAFIKEGNGNENSIVLVRTNAVLIQSDRGRITVNGIDDGTIIYVYNTNGILSGTAICRNGSAVVNSSL